MARKKRATTKASSSRKKSARKSSPKRGSKKSAKRSAAAGRGLRTVRKVGEKTWKTLKSTTAQVVEGVKETFGG